MFLYRYISYGNCSYLCFYTVLYTIEFQKRGLPHAHILIFLKGRTICLNSSEIDRFISAEIPDKENDPKGYEAVENYMIHCPCGELNRNSICMDGNRCLVTPPTTTTIGWEVLPCYKTIIKQRQ
jgi:hypothetical protein